MTEVPRSTLAGRVGVGFAIAGVAFGFLPGLLSRLPSGTTRDEEALRVLSLVGGGFFGVVAAFGCASVAVVLAALAMQAGARWHARVALAIVGLQVLTLLVSASAEDPPPLHQPPMRREPAADFPRLDARCTNAALAGEALPPGCAERGVPDR